MNRQTNRIVFARSAQIAVLFLAAIAATQTVWAQAIPTATKAIGISAFGGVERLWPDYATGGYGYFLGGGVTRHYRWFDPSIEIRYSHGSGPAVTEKTIEGGLKFEKVIGPGGRFHPYGELQAGYGIIDYKFPPYPGYDSDNSAIYGIGGGLDFDITTQFAIKGDYQYEFWSLGQGDNLNPHAASIGLVYRPHFRALGARH
jgi:opacity protein-like surface antigen